MLHMVLVPLGLVHHIHPAHVVLGTHLLLVAILLALGMIFSLLDLEHFKLFLLFASFRLHLIVLALKHLHPSPLLLRHLSLLIHGELVFIMCFLGPCLLLEHHALISLCLLRQDALRSFMLNLGALGLDTRHVGFLRFFGSLGFHLLLVMALLGPFHLQLKFMVSFLDLALLHASDRLVVLLLPIKFIGVHITFSKSHTILLGAYESRIGALDCLNILMLFLPCD